MTRGILLVEASFTILLLSFALLALTPLLATAIRASGSIDHVKQATELSLELLEEIRLHKWDALTPATPQFIAKGSTTLGPDAGEKASDKTTFDDIDDFNGWSESPPLDPTMQPLTAFANYTRSVTVSYVDASLNASAAPTDYKQVHVCTQWNQTPPVCLDTLFTNR